MYPWQKDIFDKMTGYKGKGLLQTTGAGIQVGKSQISQIYKDWMLLTRGPAKLLWKQLPGNKLKVYHDGSSRGIYPSDIDPIDDWCKQTGIGKKISDNTWQFSNEKQVTLFLLKWS
jgi:hypothetical protein